MDIEETVGYIGAYKKIYPSRRDAVESLVYEICSSTPLDIVKQRKRLIGLLQLLDKEIELNDN